MADESPPSYFSFGWIFISEIRVIRNTIISSMKKTETGKEKDAISIQVAIESFTDDDIATLRADAKGDENSRFLRLLRVVGSALTTDDISKTRIVLTGDFIGSVTSRQGESQQTTYTTKRGSGLVVGKTMPPDQNGIVDILFPLFTIMPQDDPDAATDMGHVEHVARHEAVHARLYHLGTRPFDAYQREEFGYAMKQFIVMASEQIEEHLAEQIATAATSRQNWTNAAAIEGTLNALEDTLVTKLPAIPADAPDYYAQAASVTLGAFHILWKSLAFLSAELRTGNSFHELPDEIAQLPAWNQYVAPWWSEYLRLLGEIPLSLDVDIPQTDKTVKEVAKHLQRWAKEIGFDFHDTPSGEGWFQYRRLA